MSFIDDIRTQKSLRNDFLTHLLAVFAVTILIMLAMKSGGMSDETTAGAGAFFGLFVTLVKEAYDKFWNGSFQWSDALAGAIGVGFAVLCVFVL